MEKITFFDTKSYGRVYEWSFGGDTLETVKVLV